MALVQTVLVAGAAAMGIRAMLSGDEQKVGSAPLRRDRHITVPADRWLPQYRAYVYDNNAQLGFDSKGMMTGFTPRTGAAQDHRGNAHHRKLYGTDLLHRELPYNPYQHYRASQFSRAAHYWENPSEQSRWSRIVKRWEASK